jgi:protein SCO1/2
LRAFRALLPLAAVLLLGAGCAGTGEAKRFPNAILTPEPPKAVPAVRLVTGDGKPAPKDLLEGHWTWLYFGFANCPDVCPLALEYATREYEKLRNPKAVKVVFVSVDPARDRSPKLAEFVTFYHRDFVGVTGERTDLDALTKALGASYVIEQPKKPGGGYNVSHTNLVFVLDPQGRWVATYVPGATPGAMTKDFDALTQEKP